MFGPGSTFWPFKRTPSWLFPCLLRATPWAIWGWTMPSPAVPFLKQSRNSLHHQRPIAGAIDSGVLHQTPSAGWERTAELAAATHRAEMWPNDLQADREKGALLDEIRAMLDAIDYGVLLIGPDCGPHREPRVSGDVGPAGGVRGTRADAGRDHQLQPRHRAL